MEEEDILELKKDQGDAKCTCEAVVFYEKYKDRIEKYFDKLLQLEEEVTEIADDEYGEEEYDVLQELQGTIDEYLKEKDDLKTITEISEKLKKGRRISDKKRRSKEISDGIGAGDKIVISQFDVSDVGAAPAAGDTHTDADAFAGKNSFGKKDSFGGKDSFRGKDSHRGKNAYADMDTDLKLYEHALDMKMHHLFGEDMSASEEQYSEKGYLSFPRFHSSSSDQSTVIKSSSRSSTSKEVCEEEEYSFKEREEEWMSENMKRALEYFNSHKIEDLFRFLGSHLVSANPCNPVDFLINLLEHCLSFRAGQLEPPLLFRPEHVESLFNSMDPMRTGFIDINQYHVAMITLRLKEYNMFPELAKNNLISKSVFMKEALNALTIQLDNMLRAGITEATISSISTFGIPEQ